jgi:hypothetical protein
MSIQKQMAKHRARLAKLDERLLSIVWKHSNLLTAVAALLVWIWAVVTHQEWVALGIILTGAVSYWFGVLTAVAVSVVFLAIGNFHPALSFPVLVAQTVGFLSASWLGYRHKEEKILEVERMAQSSQSSHPDQVLPWAVVNEIRTSLAAIRFLLFPIDDDKKTKELQKATLELSRLENLFHEIEKQDQRRRLP